MGLQVSIWAAIGGMVVMFLIGIYVGIHPNWIPVKTGEDFSLPAKNAIPTSEPAEIQRPPQTQPEASAQH